MRRRVLLSWLLVVSLVGPIVALGQAVPGASVVSASLEVSNIACAGGVVISSIVFYRDGVPLLTQLFVPGEEVTVGTTREFAFELRDRPTSAEIRGLIRPVAALVVSVPVGETRYQCGIIRLSVAPVAPLPPVIGPVIPPVAPVPAAPPDIRPGQTLEAVLATLRGLGLPITQEGTADSPKLSVGGPMLLRGIPGWSMHLLFVAAPGTLRSVITWDRSGVNLNLLVVGFTPWPFPVVTGVCSQWTAAGVLAEVCDRPPWGPVPGAVFLIVVINFAPTPQAYVLSLSP